MNPIIEKEIISFASLYSFLVYILKKYSKYLVFILLMYATYFFLKPSSYSSEVSFYTNYTESSSSLSSLGVLSSLGGFNSESNDLKFSVSNYLNSDKLLRQVVEKEYVIGKDKDTLINFWGNSYDKIFSKNPISLLKKMNRRFSLISTLSIEEKKLLFAKEKLARAISYVEDRRSSLHTITVKIDGNYPLLSKNIVDSIFKSIISYSTEVTSIKAKEKRNFIEGRLSETKENLESAEENMQLFLEKNKNIISPSLVLQEERIQRDIVLYNQLYLNLSDQLEASKIDEKDNTSSIFLLDEPETSPYKSGRSLFESLLLISTLLFSMLLFFEGFKNKNQLFK